MSEKHKHRRKNAKPGEEGTNPKTTSTSTETQENTATGNHTSGDKEPGPPAVIPDALCEPVFVVDQQPLGEHLSRALELNVPVVVLRTSKSMPDPEDPLAVLFSGEPLPSHPSIQSDYAGHPSMVPHFKQLWRDFVRDLKTRLAEQEQDGKARLPAGGLDWDRHRSAGSDPGNRDSAF